MMHAMLSDVLFYIIIFGLLFGGSVAAFLNKWMNQRHARKLLEDEHRQEMQRLVERRRIAELEGDAIKLLLADMDLVADFDRRLNKAMIEAGLKKPPLLPPAQVEEAQEEKPAKRKRAAR